MKITRKRNVALALTAAMLACLLSLPANAGMRQPLEKDLNSGSAITLGASFAILGSAVDIAGMGQITLEITAAGTGNTVLEAYTTGDYQAAAPTAVTSLATVLTDSLNTPVTWGLTVATGSKVCVKFPPVAAKWLVIRGKYSATNGTVVIKVTGNVANT